VPRCCPSHDQRRLPTRSKKTMYDLAGDPACVRPILASRLLIVCLDSKTVSSQNYDDVFLLVCCILLQTRSMPRCLVVSCCEALTATTVQLGLSCTFSVVIVLKAICRTLRGCLPGQWAVRAHPAVLSSGDTLTNLLVGHWCRVTFATFL
jgi:hypothetical protein